MSNATSSSSVSVATKQQTAVQTSSSMDQRPQMREANMKLIRAVQRYRLLYDSNHPNYAKKTEVDKTWTVIARSCGEPAPSCKERWRNIRAAFARSINIYKTQSGPNRVKPYYLHKELEFLVKFMLKGRQQPLKNGYSSDENRESSDAAHEDVDDEVEEDEADEEEIDGDEEKLEQEEPTDANAVRPANGVVTDSSQTATNNAPIVDNSTINETNASSSIGNHVEPNAELIESSDEAKVPDDVQLIGSPPKRRNLYEYDQAKNVLKRVRLDRFEDMPDHADLCFVKSLYYDMRPLSATQKLRFKTGTYQLLEQVTATTTAAAATTASTTITSSMPAAPTTTTVAPARHSKNTSLTMTPQQQQSWQYMGSLNNTQLQHLNAYIQGMLQNAPNENQLSDSSPLAVFASSPRASNVAKFNRLNHHTTASNNGLLNGSTTLPEHNNVTNANSNANNNSNSMPTCIIKEEDVEGLVQAHSPAN